MTSPNECSPQRGLACSGALLFSIGLFTGIWTSLALTGAVVVKIPHLALATHLNALLGGLWLLAVSYSFQFLRYDDKQLRRLSYLAAVPAWANWLITLVASFLGVDGLSIPLASTQDTANNIIGLLLKFIVVFPSFFAAIYWMRGFMRSPKALRG